jgi:DNA-binding CsgD family transcriptional regulator
MATKKFPGAGGPTGPVRGADEDYKCPSCGAWGLEGGCADPTACAQAVARMEKNYALEIADPADDTDHRSFHLMMAGFEALDLLNIGLAVTSASGHLLMANRTAENILETRDGLELTSRGRLRALNGLGSRFTEFLEDALKVGSREGSQAGDAVLAVPRPAGKRPLTVLVRSVHERSSKGGPMAPAALLFILDPGITVEAAESDLHELYGLTSSEARLANLLMEGKTLNECCDQLGIRRSTGRTHLQHLFEKVGAQRQSELVFLLLKSIGLVRATNKEKKSESPPPATNFGEAYLRMLITRVTRTSSQ